MVDDDQLLKKVQKISNSTSASPRTVIMLPIKVRRNGYLLSVLNVCLKSYDDIAANLVDFSRSPMVILFLKKMKFIRVHIERQKSSWTNVFIERVPEANPCCWTVRIALARCNGSFSFYLVWFHVCLIGAVSFSDYCWRAGHK